VTAATSQDLRGSLSERWEDLPKVVQRLLAAGGTLLLLLFVYNAPGISGFMDDRAPYGVLVIGAIVGTVTALLAMGLILIYRSARFINFAYASMGSLAGTFAIGLHLEKGWNYFAVLPIGVAIGVVVGVIVELVVRRFRAQSRLILTVASIGLAQVLGVVGLGLAQSIGFISLTGGFETPLDVSLVLGVKTLTGNETLIVAVVPLVIAGLAWFLLRTDAGVAIRAAAENEDRALLLGIPVYKLGRIVWIIAGGLSALTFMLKAPFAGVTPDVATSGATLLLPALAAAVVARMESLPMAFAAGIGLGIIEQLVRWNQDFFNSPSATDVVFLVVILVALLVQRAKISRAVDSESMSVSLQGIIKPVPEELRHLREVRIGKVVLVGLVAIAAFWVPYTWSPSSQLLAAVAMVWAIVGVSLVLLSGWGGHISLGQFAVAGMGGVVAGNLLDRYNLDYFLALVAAGAAGALVALVVGVPALRIKGLFLAVTTLAFAVALDSWFLNFNNFPDLIPTDITRPVVWERFDLERGYPMYVMCLSLLIACIAVGRSVRKTRAGRVIIATRDNQRAADSAGVPTTKIKLTAFLVAGAMAGLAGGLHVTILHSLNPGTYKPDLSIEVFATAVIGGLGSISGAISGILLFQYLSTLSWLGQARLLVSGAGLLVVLLFFPGGLAQLAQTYRDKYLRRLAKKYEIHVPSLLADKRTEDSHEAAEEVKAEEEALMSGALT
jgi:branched-chain amino acid transport system permease protein